MSVALDTTQPVMSGPPLPSAAEQNMAQSSADPGQLGMGDWGGGFDALFLDTATPLAGATPEATPPVDPGPPAAALATPSAPAAPAVQATPPSSSAPPPAPSADPSTATPSPLASESVETLRAELATLKETAELVKTEKFQQARIVAEVLNANPLEFVREYLPDVVETIRSESVVDAISQRAETPEDFIFGYADQKLAEKFPDFMPDPSEMLVHGSESWKYTRERERLIHEGSRVLQERQAQENLRQHEIQQEQQNAFIEAAAAAGYGADTVPKLTEIVQGFQPTQKDYYLAVLRYMQAEGHFKDIATSAPAAAAPQGGQPTATPAPAAAPDRLHDNIPPPPGVQNIPGATQADASNMTDMTELFGPLLS